jgi:hypothetical protein
LDIVLAGGSDVHRVLKPFILFDPAGVVAAADVRCALDVHIVAAILATRIA